MRSILIWAALSVAAPVAAQPSGSNGPNDQAIRTALERGALLYLYDEAAWRGSDDLRQNFAQLLPLAGGYVVSGERSAVELMFYDKAKSKAVYRAKFSDGKRVSSGRPAVDRVELTPVEQRLIAARAPAMQAFTDAKVGLCSKSTPNVALLPPKVSTDPVRAYLMTARTAMKSLPLGGHFEVDVSADGRAGTVRAFTKSCLEMSLVGDGKGQTKALVVSHLLDPTPTEIHVFSSLTGKVPIYVMTMPNRTLWVVAGSKIKRVPHQPTAKQ